jgi:hypothetical protein
MHNLTHVSDVTNEGFRYKIFITHTVGRSFGRSVGRLVRFGKPLNSSGLLSRIESNASFRGVEEEFHQRGLFPLLLRSSLIGRFCRVEMSGI